MQNSPDLVNHQLYIAAQNGYVSAAEFLMAHGADPNRSSALQEAAGTGNDAMVQALLSHGAEVDSRDDSVWGRTALYRAAQKGFMTVCRTLVAHGADVNAKNKDGSTPLDTAIGNGQFVAAEFLITNKAQISPDVLNQDLLGAARNGDLSKAEFLIAHGADVNLRAPIVAAAVQGSEAMVRLLLSHGAKVDGRGDGGRAALGYAVERGFMPVCHTLVEHGADVNAKDDHGVTPLIIRGREKEPYSKPSSSITNKAQIDVRRGDGLRPF